MPMMLLTYDDCNDFQQILNYFFLFRNYILKNNRNIILSMKQIYYQRLFKIKNMKRGVCFITVIFLLGAFSIQIQQTPEESSFSPNKPVTINWSALQEFPNQTGSSFGDPQLRSLINFINTASYNYLSDVPKNIKYIKDNMDASFGSQFHQYSVVIESAEKRGFGYATIYCEGGSNYAFIGYGVNLKYPTWTYLVYLLASPNQVTYDYLNYYINRGSGLPADQGAKIEKVIKKLENKESCDCSLTTQISDRVEDTISGYWNVVCQNGLNINSCVGIYNSTWIMLKPAKCTYFLYAVQ